MPGLVVDGVDKGSAAAAAVAAGEKNVVALLPTEEEPIKHRAHEVTSLPCAAYVPPKSWQTWNSVSTAVQAPYRQHFVFCSKRQQGKRTNEKPRCKMPKSPRGCRIWLTSS